MKAKNEIKVKGFYRLQIVDETGKIVGDTGRRQNTITAAGWQYCIGGLPLKCTGAYDAEYGALGSGTDAITSDQSVLDVLITTTAAYVALSTAQSADSAGATARVTFQYASTNMSATSARIAEIGLHSANTSGGLVCAATFDASTVSSNQSVNCTYDITFS